MSAFPVTICDVGFIERRTKQRLSLRNDTPNLQGLRLPVRLDPRERLQSDQVPDPTKSKLKVLDKAYAVTACEVERWGDSPALKRLRKKLRTEKGS
jgi:hypothetical protein